MSKNGKKKAVEIDDHIVKRFEIKKRIGKGAYGIVWKAMDRKTREVIALKKIYDAFRNPTDAQRTFREIMFLQAFRNHPNIVRLYSIHRAINNQDIYLGFEYMETDLHNVIKRGNILKDIHKRYIMYQMLSATNYIHSGNVIHRDQKPSNVLLDSQCRAKIADFGLARSVNHRDNTEGEMEIDPTLTNYVATRWYRAPEILTASKKYSKCVDMWSLGCILGEMLRGKPLFQGTSTVNQVEKIMSALPIPSQEDIISVCSGYGSALVSNRPAPDKSLHSLLEGYPPDARDLVESLIVFNPNHRLTAAEAMDHQYVSRFYRKTGEMVMPGNVVPPLRDDVQLTVDEYRSKLYEFINEGPGRCSSSINSSGKAQSRSLRSALGHQRTAPSTPPPHVLTLPRQRSLILRQRHDPTDIHVVFQKPQPLIKRVAGQGDEQTFRIPQDHRRMQPQQMRHHLVKSTSTGSANNDILLKQPIIRKTMSGKPHMATSEPKICYKRKVEISNGRNHMVPISQPVEVRRMEQGLSQLSLNNPSLYQGHLRNSDSNVRSKLEVIYNHGDYLENREQRAIRQNSSSKTHTAPTYERRNKTELNSYLKHLPKNMKITPQNPNKHLRDGISSHMVLNQNCKTRQNKVPKRFTSSSDESSATHLCYQDYGVITASALQELTRNIHSGVR